MNYSQVGATSWWMAAKRPVCVQSAEEWRPESTSRAALSLRGSAEREKHVFTPSRDDSRGSYTEQFSTETWQEPPPPPAFWWQNQLQIDTRLQADFWKRTAQCWKRQKTPTIIFLFKQHSRVAIKFCGSRCEPSCFSIPRFVDAHSALLHTAHSLARESVIKQMLAWNLSGGCF